MNDLTEKLKKGELPDNHHYYFKLPKSKEYEVGDTFCLETLHWCKDGDKIEVLSEVPSYDEYQQLLSDQLAKNEGVEINAELEAENTKLKEQINHLSKTQARQFVDNQKLQIKAKHAKDVVNIDTARQIKQLKELLKQAYPLFNYKDVSARTEFEKEWLAKVKKILGEE